MALSFLYSKCRDRLSRISPRLVFQLRLLCNRCIAFITAIIITINVTQAQLSSQSSVSCGLQSCNQCFNQCSNKCYNRRCNECYRLYCYQFITAVFAEFLKLLVVESIAAFLPEMSAIDCNALPISTSIYYHKYVVDMNMHCESFGIISATINIIYVNI